MSSLVVGVGLAGVGAGLDALGAQPLGDAVRVGDGERVDDAGAGQRRQHLREPGEPVGLRAELDRIEGEGLAVERAADGEELRAELRLDVGDDPVVGGRRRAQHRHAAGQEIEDAGEAAVVGPEVVAPVADAVHLVDHEQPGAARPLGAPRSRNAWLAKRSGETSRASTVLASSSLDDLVPDLLVVAVDGGGAQAAALGRFDLVAHEAEQGRDEQRRARAAGAQQRGGHEVDRALAPAGALHDEHAPPIGDERGDGLELPVTELGRGIADEPAQGVGGFGGEGPSRSCRRPYRPPGTGTLSRAGRWRSSRRVPR